MPGDSVDLVAQIAEPLPEVRFNRVFILTAVLLTFFSMFVGRSLRSAGEAAAPRSSAELLRIFTFAGA